MPSGIERRVGEHRDPVENNPVEEGGARGITPSPPLHRLTFFVGKKDRPIFVGTKDRGNGLVGTDHRAHAAADAQFALVGLLADPGKGAVIVAPIFVENIQLGYPLPHVRQPDGTFRAHRGAVAAKGAPVFAVLDNPGQIGRG